MKSPRNVLILALAITALDLAWLGGVMSGFYRDQLGSMLRLRGDSIDAVVWAGGVVYLLIAAGITLFVLPRAKKGKGRTKSALGWGFVFGTILYGVYDFTNLSILASWPLPIVAVDVAWGGVIGAVGSALAARIDRA